MIKYPLFLKDGDIIAITAPSDGANLEYLDGAINNLKKYGFNVIETNSVRSSELLVSSDAKTRANEFLQVFLDDKISHIIAASGGEFLNDIIPYLHEQKEKIKNIGKIKYVQGFSDISLLNFYLTTNYNLPTINANNVGDFCTTNLDKSNVFTIDFLKGKYGKTFIQESYKKYQNSYTENKLLGYNLTNDVIYKALNGESKLSFEGRIIGGCIDVLIQLVGTKYDNTINFCNKFEEGIIWYFDNCELSSMELYRRLYQLKEIGWFGNAKGFLFGRSAVDVTYGDFSYVIAIKKALKNLNVPIIYDVDIGHVMPQFTIVNGSFAKFKYDSGKGEIIQELK